MGFNPRHELDTTRGLTIHAATSNALVKVVMAQGATPDASFAAQSLLRAQDAVRQH